MTAWFVCHAKCADARLALQERVFWSSELKDSLCCPVCAEFQKPSSVQDLPHNQRRILKDWLRNNAIPDSKEHMSHWLFCQGFHAGEASKDQLFWSAKGIDKVDPTCPRCGGCCPAPFFTVSIEEQGRLGQYIRDYSIPREGVD